MARVLHQRARKHEQRRRRTARGAGAVFSGVFPVRYFVCFAVFRCFVCSRGWGGAMCVSPGSVVVMPSKQSLIYVLLSLVFQGGSVQGC